MANIFILILLLWPVAVFANLPRNIFSILPGSLINLPQSVTLKFDLNGNLTNDGTRSFFYDAENQLTNVLVANKFKKDFVYDGLRRLRVKREYSWTGSAWQQTNETRFVWDRSAIVQLRNSYNVPTLTLTRGLDLSGSLQRAGGIGGLLAMTDGNGASYFYHGDGLGNVTALMDASESIVARRMYDAFGRTIFLGGSKAGLNPFWHASQLHDEDTDLYHYKRRPYSPTLQRWLGNDPIQEAGGINLVTFVRNNPMRYVDRLGLQDAEPEGPVRTVPEALKTPEENFEDALNDNQVFGAQTEDLSEEINREIDLENEAIEAANVAEEAQTEAAKAARLPETFGSEGDNKLPSTVTSPLPVRTPCPGNNIRAPLKIDEEVYRNWGGKSGPFRLSWTRDPYTKQSRDSLGIDYWNTGEFLSIGTVKDTSGTTTRNAEPAGPFKGGGDEVLIPNSQQQIELKAVEQIELKAVVMPDAPIH